MRKKPFLVLLFFFILALMIYLSRDFSVVKSINSFLQLSVSSTRVFLFSGQVEREKDIVRENRELREKISEFENLKRENDALRSQFEENMEAKYFLLPVRIIGFKGRGVYEIFSINAGTNQNIKTGMSVISGKTLVGIISKTSENISEVTTILNPKFSTLVKYSATGARGILRGLGSFAILDNVLITDKLEEDGQITTMGEVNDTNIGIPSDLIVGKIRSIDREETAAFQEARVDPIIDYSRITDVFVILGL